MTPRALAAVTQRRTSAEVAAELRMSTRVLCEKAARGEIRASKVGRQWLFDPEDVEAYVAARTNVAPTPTRRRRRRSS